MKDYYSLKLTDKFKWVFHHLGVDYHLMRLILQQKLTMDGRRSSIINPANSKRVDNKLRSFFVYGFYGLITLLFLFLPASLFIRMTLIFSVLFFMITSIMISDFSIVLLDLKDKNILMARPIEERTINFSKVVHIFINLFKISIAFTLPMILVGVFKEGIYFPLILLFELFFIISLIIFFTSFIYGFVLYFFDGEKLKDIINYTQIGLAVLLPVSYQFISELFEVFNNSVVLKPSWWAYLFPPVWFAAPFQIFLSGDYTISYLILSAMALFVPVIGLVLYNKLIAGFFERYLIKMDNIQKRRKTYTEYLDRLDFRVTSCLSKNYQEAVFLRFIRRVLSRERMLKLFIYPIISFSFIFPFLFLRREIDFNSFILSIRALSRGSSYMWFYSSVIFLPTINTILSYSGDYQGAWIYRVVPIDDFAMLNKARVKAVIIKYGLPLFMCITLFFSYFYGIRVLDDLLLMFLNLILLTLLLTIIGGRDLPFSYELSVQTKLSRTALLLIVSSVTGGMLTYLHNFFINNNYSLWPDIFITTIVVLLLWRLMIRVSGNIKISKSYNQ